MAAHWLAAVPLLGLLALVVLAPVVLRRSLAPGWRRSALVLRAVGYALPLVLAAVWCLRGLYGGEVGALVALTLTALVGGALALLRPQVVAWLGRRVVARGSGAGCSLAALLVIVAALAAASALELAWNVDFLSAGLPFQLLELAMLLLTMVALYLLTDRRGLGMAVVVVACCLVGIAQYFVMRFKDVAIFPSDLFALRTAAAVGKNYTYEVDDPVVAALTAALIGIVATSLVGCLRQALPAPSSRRRRVTAAVGVAAACALVALVSVPNFIDDMGVKVMYFGGYSLVSYRRQGFLTAFVAAAQNIGIRRPDAYDASAAVRDEAALVAAYDNAADGDAGRAAATAQFAADKPTIIVIMNETFADLSTFSVLADVGYAGPTRFNAVNDALVRGSLAVSVLGGGTCNTEFEFLTGISYGLVGEGKYPYVMYQLAPFDNLARQLSGLGYTCTAMHPNEPGNWNRDVVYADMGFDRFLSIKDFVGAEELHSGVSDAATYDKVLALLAANDTPQFIFDVTMQNHSGYDQHNVPASLMAHYGLERYADDAWTTNAIDEYLACIEASDQALAALMDELTQLDRHVVLVFFGDHQPHFSAWINDDLYDDADDLTHSRRVYQTSYLVWANYDVAGRTQASELDDTSPDTLAAMMLDLVGAPLTELQRARLAARNRVPAVSMVGYEGADGTWYAPGDEGPYRETYDLIARLNYLNFGSRV